MKNYEMRETETGVHIEGVPNAVKLVALQGKQAERLGHLALHRSDLRFVLECLAQINETTNEILREAAWRAAIVAFVKCFTGGGRRSQLHANSVYSGNAPAKSAFEYINNLRDKHLAHDENAYQQCHPGAIINAPGIVPKVDNIITLAISGVSLEQSAYNNLHQLATDAIRYVEGEYDRSVEGLKAALEKEEYGRLIERPSVSYRLPPASEVGRRRTGP